MTNDTDPDYETVLRCQKGDVDAFEQIVVRHQKKMFNISLRMTGDYNEAAEVVQDAFVSAYKNIKGFRGNSSFSTWLCTIVINLSRNRLKQIKARARREPYSINDPVTANDGEMDPPSNDVPVPDRLESHQMQQRVQECIKSLDDEFRDVVVLRDIQGFSYNQICDMLMLAEGTVKSRLHRARESLRSCLKRQLGEL
ncbi:MAG: sigma-70 family RNA polymerase sigma factor [Nitrospiraceae bacterium]|nr:MAG: sigma-70 family RNA polymerase sigma factor [Nitrospiraceae bacterium]